jgi:hypothetical protein
MQILKALLHISPDKIDFFFGAREVSGDIYRICPDITRRPPLISLTNPQNGHHSVDLFPTFIVHWRDWAARRLTAKLTQQ